MILQNQSQYLKKIYNYTGIPIRTQAQSGYIPTPFIRKGDLIYVVFTFQSGYIPIICLCERKLLYNCFTFQSGYIPIKYYKIR